MSYMIDAWLERPDPYIRVVHKERRISVLQWRGRQVREMIDNGMICVLDFAEQNTNEQELVKELFVLSCLNDDY